MPSNRCEWFVGGGVLLALLLPLAFNPFASEPFESTKVMLFQAVTIGMTLAAVILSVSDRSLTAQPMATRLIQIWRHIGLPAAPIALYAIAVLVATFASIDVDLSIWGSGDRHGTATTLLTLLFFLLLLTSLKRWNQIDGIVTAIIVGSVPVAFYGWIQYMGLDALQWISFSISPVHSTLGRSVFLGAYMTMVIPFTLSRTLVAHRRRHGYRRAAHAALFMLQVGCLIFTLARGAWLGFLGALFLFIALLLPRRRRAVLSTVVVLIVGIVMFAIIVQFGGEIFPETVGTPSGERFMLIRSWSNQARLTTWRDALALIPRRWIFGFGPETYAKALSQANLVNPFAENAWMHQDDPHNLWLFQMTEVGVVGLLALLWLALRYYRALLAAFNACTNMERKITMAAIFGSTTAYFIHAQFNPDVITLTLFFWMGLALGFAATNLAMQGDGDLALRSATQVGDPNQRC